MRPSEVSVTGPALCRGLAGGTADGGRQRQHALARNLLATVEADAIAAFGDALLRLLDLMQPGTVDFHLRVAHVAEAFCFGLVSLTSDFMVLGRRVLLDIGGSAGDLVERSALHGLEPMSQFVAFS